MNTHRYAAAAAAAVLSLSLASAQTTYDDFSGNAIDKSKWIQIGDLSRATQFGGFLQMFGRGFDHDFALVALRGLDGSGNFTLDLDFQGFRAGNLESAFGLAMSQPGPKPHDLSIGMGTYRNSQGQIEVGFTGEILLGGILAGSSSRGTFASTATAGILRITRVGNDVELWHRAAGQASFTSLARATNYFTATDITFGIEVTAELTEGADVFCDKVVVTGGLVPNATITAVGNRCLDLGAIAIGFPRAGNPYFTLLGIGDASYRGDPYFFVLGVNTSPLNFQVPGAPGCTLYVAPQLLLGGSFDMYGEAQIGLPIAPGIATGTSIEVQFAGVTNRNAVGLALSNGLRCTVF